MLHIIYFLCFFFQVLIIDPLSEDSMSLITLAQSLYAHSAPLRIGFVFVANYNTSVIGLTDASVAVNNAYHYFADTKSNKEALHFLAEVKLCANVILRVVTLSMKSKKMYFCLS